MTKKHDFLINFQEKVIFFCKNVCFIKNIIYICIVVSDNNEKESHHVFNFVKENSCFIDNCVFKEWDSLTTIPFSIFCPPLLALCDLSRTGFKTSKGAS